MILAIVILTGAMSYLALIEGQQASAEIKKLNEDLAVQIQASTDLSEQNYALRIQVAGLSALSSEIRAIVLETLKVTGHAVEDRQNTDALASTPLSLNIGQYYTVDTSLKLYTSDGSVDTLVPQGQQLVLMPNTPFEVTDVRAVGGEIQYLISFPLRSTNSDFDWVGTQSRTILQRDLDGVEIEISSYHAFETMAR